MMVRSATFLFDTPPIAADAARILDFSSFHHYAALAEPLFRWDAASRAAQRSACARMEESESGLRLELHLRDDLFWSDGTAVTAEDYARALDGVIRGRSPHAARLRSIERVSLRSDAGRERLVIDTRWPDRHLPAKLSHPSCSVLDDVAADRVPRRTAGPFTEIRREQRGSTLRRNPFHRTAVGRDRPSDIRFEVCDSADEGIERYLDGAADATCPALFPYRRLRSLSGRDDFIRSPSNTFAVLLPVSARALDAGLRKRVQAAIDREALVRRLDGAMAALRGFVDARPPRPASAEILEPVENLIIAYDDFSPNSEIATAVQDDLRRAGLDVVLHVDSFSRPQRSCDFRLVILVNSNADPSSIFVHLGLTPAVALDDEHRDRYWSLLRQYDQSSSGTEHLIALDTMIEQHAYALLLGRLEQYYLRSSRVAPFQWDSDVTWEQL